MVSVCMGEWKMERGKKKSHQRFLGLGEGAGPNNQEAPRLREGGKQGTVREKK